MEIYEKMRIFADSWGLLFMFVVFISVVVFTLRPGSRQEHADAANIPFRHDDKPGADRAPASDNGE